jgi:hypothetical protein
LTDLLKFADKNDTFGFKDELERSQALQWTFFWHGSGAPYQGKSKEIRNTILSSKQNQNQVSYFFHQAK